MISQSSYDLLVVVKDILNAEVVPLVSSSQGENPSIDLTPVTSRLDTIIDFLNSLTPPLYGLYTCVDNYSVTTNAQIIPFDVVFGGNINCNSDGSITLPANKKFLIDCDVNGIYTVSTYSTYALYDCDTGVTLFSFSSYSENNNSFSDFGEIRTAEVSSGASGRRIGVKCTKKHNSGTLLLTQYQTFIKIVEV